MLFHQYLETLLGSKTKIRILRTLRRHRGKEFTIRELANFINTSHTGVRKALDDLYEMNVVSLKAVGRSHTVTMNNESHLAALLDYLFKYEEKTLAEVQALIKKHLCHQTHIESVTIFGSVARGEEEPRSDIDLLVLTDDKETAEYTVSELQIEFSRRFGNLLAPYILTSGEMENLKGSQILEEIQNHRIIVCSEPRVGVYVNEN